MFPAWGTVFCVGGDIVGRLRINYARIDYLRRHLRNFLPYLTPKKVANVLLNESELRRRVPRPRSLPPYLKLEPTPLCQLRCPGCRHNEQQYKKQFRGNMFLTLSNTRKVIEPLRSTLLGVSLSHLGEPFMNPELLDIVEYLHDARIAVSFPTNFSFHFSDEKIARIALSGVDNLMISLDGASEETYEVYRQGGNFRQVLDNVHRLAAAKKKLGRRRPLLTWKFVVFDHNRHEVPKVRGGYRELGFDAYELVSDNASRRSTAERERVARRTVQREKGCYWLWNTMVVRWDGRVNPCCSTQIVELGNAFSENPAEIWRNTPYTTLRAGFRGRPFGHGMHPRCRRCLGLTESSPAALVMAAAE